MNSAFFSLRIPPLFLQSGDGVVNGGKNFKDTFKPISYVTIIYDFIFLNSAPSEKKDGSDKGGEIFKGTYKPVSFVTQGFWMSLIVNRILLFRNSTSRLLVSSNRDGKGGETFKNTCKLISFGAWGFLRSLINKYLF